VRYRARGWDVWLGLGCAAAIVSLVVLQRWWFLPIHVAWIGGYLWWRHTHQLPLPTDDGRAPPPPPMTGADASGWSFERNPDGRHTWTHVDGRRVVI
jgi:hypothetical protein